MTDIKFFKESIEKFKGLDGKTDYYILAKELINKGFENYGCLLILTTWNISSFQYNIKIFDFDFFSKELNSLKENEFKELEGLIFETINFEEYRNKIESIYKKLSEIVGVSHTGATKIMHLLNDKLFIMWDRYIRVRIKKNFMKI